jgi:hypothetical protein
MIFYSCGGYDSTATRRQDDKCHLAKTFEKMMVGQMTFQK